MAKVTAFSVVFCLFSLLTLGFAMIYQIRKKLLGFKGCHETPCGLLGFSDVHPISSLCAASYTQTQLHLRFIAHHTGLLHAWQWSNMCGTAGTTTRIPCNAKLCNTFPYNQICQTVDMFSCQVSLPHVAPRASSTAQAMSNGPPFTLFNSDRLPKRVPGELPKPGISMAS